jgi:hypothetical protein
MIKRIIDLFKRNGLYKHDWVYIGNSESIVYRTEIKFYRCNKCNKVRLIYNEGDSIKKYRKGCHIQ